jgi:hypothetical protein
MKHEDGKQKLFTTEETAEMLRQSSRTITAWANAYQDSGGKEGIHGIKFGRQWHFNAAEIEHVMTTGVVIQSKKFDKKSPKAA